MLNQPRYNRAKRRRSIRTGDRNGNLFRILMSPLRERWPFIKVLLIYVFSLLSLFTLYWIINDTGPFWRFLQLNAHATGFMVSLFGPGTHIIGNQVFSDVYSISIIDECTALASFIIFGSGIIAFPGKWKNKLPALLFGFIALNFLNLLRTTSLFYIGYFQPNALDVAHFMVWQGLMILAALGLWFVCVRRFKDA